MYRLLGVRSWPKALDELAPELQSQMKELIEGTTPVICKRFAVYKPTFAIESQRRIEGGTDPGLQAEPAHTAPLRYANKLFQSSTRISNIRLPMGS